LPAALPLLAVLLLLLVVRGVSDLPGCHRVLGVCPGALAVVIGYWFCGHLTTPFPNRRRLSQRLFEQYHIIFDSAISDAMYFR
jgi:hypothetical protein